MSKNGKSINDDYVSAGFKRLDPRLLAKHPPQIQWGMLYKEWGPDKKIKYLENLASVMNHAADLIQTERNALGVQIELKEAQLIKLSEAVRTNNAMLQQEVTRMNEQRQFYNEEVARLSAKIRELKGADND